MSDFVQHNAVRCSFNTSDSWIILTPIEQSIKSKIEAIGTPLREWDVQINYGIKTGYNEAFIITSDKREELLSNCKDEAERLRTADLIRPILRGRDIKRYGYNWADLWLIATFPARHYNIEDYPAVKEYLLSIGKERLEQTGTTHIIEGEKIKSRKKTNNAWFETQDSISYWEDFSKPQIAWLELSDDPKFTLVENIVSLNTVFIMTGDDIKHILGILNSKLITWYFHSCIGTSSGVGTNRWLKYTIGLIPIVKRDEALINLVEEMIKTPSPDIDKLIHGKVNDLYALNEKEKDFIDNLCI